MHVRVFPMRQSKSIIMIRIVNNTAIETKFNQSIFSEKLKTHMHLCHIYIYVGVNPTETFFTKITYYF